MRTRNKIHRKTRRNKKNSKNKLIKTKIYKNKLIKTKKYRINGGAFAGAVPFGALGAVGDFSVGAATSSKNKVSFSKSNSNMLDEIITQLQNLKDTISINSTTGYSPIELIFRRKSVQYIDAAIDVTACFIKGRGDTRILDETLIPATSKETLLGLKADAFASLEDFIHLCYLVISQHPLDSKFKVEYAKSIMETGFKICEFEQDEGGNYKEVTVIEYDPSPIVTRYLDQIRVLEQSRLTLSSESKPDYNALLVNTMNAFKAYMEWGVLSLNEAEKTLFTYYQRRGCPYFTERGKKAITFMQNISNRAAGGVLNNLVDLKLLTDGIPGMTHPRIRGDSESLYNLFIGPGGASRSLSKLANSVRGLSTQTIPRTVLIPGQYYEKMTTAVDRLISETELGKGMFRIYGRSGLFKTVTVDNMPYSVVYFCSINAEIDSTDTTSLVRQGHDNIISSYNQWDTVTLDIQLEPTLRHIEPATNILHNKSNAHKKGFKMELILLSLFLQESRKNVYAFCIGCVMRGIITQYEFDKLFAMIIYELEKTGVLYERAPGSSARNKRLGKGEFIDGSIFSIGGCMFQFLISIDELYEYGITLKREDGQSILINISELLESIFNETDYFHFSPTQVVEATTIDGVHVSHTAAQGRVASISTATPHASQDIEDAVVASQEIEDAVVASNMTTTPPVIIGGMTPKAGGPKAGGPKAGTGGGQEPKIKIVLGSLSPKMTPPPFKFPVPQGQRKNPRTASDTKPSMMEQILHNPASSYGQPSSVMPEWVNMRGQPKFGNFGRHFEKSHLQLATNAVRNRAIINFTHARTMDEQQYLSFIKACEQCGVLDGEINEHVKRHFGKLMIIIAGGVGQDASPDVLQRDCTSGATLMHMQLDKNLDGKLSEREIALLPDEVHNLCRLYAKNGLDRKEYAYEAMLVVHQGLGSLSLITREEITAFSHAVVGMCVTSVYQKINYTGTTTSQVITIRDNLMSMISRGPKLGYGVIALSMYCSTLLKQKECAAASSSSNQPLSRSKEIYEEYMSLFTNLTHEINTGLSLGAAASDEDVETGENDL